MSECMSVYRNSLNSVNNRLKEYLPGEERISKIRDLAKRYAPQISAALVVGLSLVDLHFFGDKPPVEDNGPSLDKGNSMLEVAGAVAPVVAKAALLTAAKAGISLSVYLLAAAGVAKASGASKETTHKMTKTAHFSWIGAFTSSHFSVMPLICATVAAVEGAKAFKSWTEDQSEKSQTQLESREISKIKPGKIKTIAVGSAIAGLTGASVLAVGRSLSFAATMASVSALRFALTARRFL